MERFCQQINASVREPQLENVGFVRDFQQAWPLRRPDQQSEETNERLDACVEDMSDCCPFGEIKLVADQQFQNELIKEDLLKNMTFRKHFLSRERHTCKLENLGWLPRFVHFAFYKNLVFQFC